MPVQIYYKDYIALKEMVRDKRLTYDLLRVNYLDNPFTQHCQKQQFTVSLFYKNSDYS